MAQYKVPQDVEADDKLLGPLSFRQFIYAGIALGGVVVGVFLFQIFPLLIIIPLPVVVLFGAVALPLRKDQPMETYLLALLRFYLKPKLRLWNPDGTITYVEITAPKLVEQHLIKDFDANSAQQRLDYLARVMDSRGWALKNAVESQNSVRPDIAAEVQQAPDIMDETASLSKSFDNLIAKTDEQHKNNARQQMVQAAAPSIPAPTAAPAQAAASTVARPDDTGITPLHYNPYPSSMHQKVIHTVEEQDAATAKAAAQTAAKAKANTVPPEVSPAIMNLVRNGDLSLAAMSREAHRLEDKEVVINLH